MVCAAPSTLVSENALRDMMACQIERPARKGTVVDASVHNEVIP